MIREASEKDLREIEQIYNELHTLEENGAIRTGWIRKVYPTRQTAEKAMRDRELFVFEEDGTILASMRINQKQEESYSDADWQYEAADEEIMILHTLTVRPDLRGRGIGSDMVRFYEDFALENGCRVLRLDTNETNTGARSLYRKLGYREAGIVECEFNGIPGVKLVCLEKKI